MTSMSLDSDSSRQSQAVAKAAAAKADGSADNRASDPESRDPAYFSYYAQFVHQQNMLQDNQRTAMYHTAIMSNGPLLFKDKFIVDVGAGSGILSYFAAQCEAKKVYAIEASGMATKIKKMIQHADKNPWMRDRIEVIQAKVETVTGLPAIDTLISEPIGVLLVHERMIESFLYARDNFLKPGGAMIPSSGTIFLAPFTDANLWTQTMSKVRFWEQSHFFGVDFSPLARDAKEEIFAQPVVGNFDYRVLMAPTCKYFVDFTTVSVDELKDFVIPISWIPQYTGIIHGIAGWFDINLGGFNLSTAPNAERTHWQQVRFLFKEPLAVNAFEPIKGFMRLSVNNMRSYDVIAELVVGDSIKLSTPQDEWVGVPLGVDTEIVDYEKRFEEGASRRRRGKWALHEQTYWYANENLGPEYSRPEYLALYTPDNVSEEMKAPAAMPPVTFGGSTNL